MKTKETLRPLFTPLDSFCKESFALFPQLLNKVLPLSKAHRADLPDAIRELSALLTTEREGLGRSYWAKPRFASAYLRYFLPWNILRIARLLPKLDLPVLPETNSPHERPLVVDAGTGPLTLPIALWLSRPDYRKKPLHIVCADTAPRPMMLGKALLEGLAALCKEELLWDIDCRRIGLGQILHKGPRNVTLYMAGNVLNEIKTKRDTSLSERMEDMLASLQRNLHPEGRALFIEPGTRYGGTLTANLREAAIELASFEEEGLCAISPCTHTNPCPLLGRKERGWCHVVHDAGAPLWLASLAREAKLPKDSLALSFVLLANKSRDFFEANQQKKPKEYGRIISDAFRVPRLGFSRYACTNSGLALVGNAASVPSGASVLLESTRPVQHDAKSGALIMRHFLPKDLPIAESERERKNFISEPVETKLPKKDKPLSKEQGKAKRPQKEQGKKSSKASQKSFQEAKKIATNTQVEKKKKGKDRP